MSNNSVCSSSFKPALHDPRWALFSGRPVSVGDLPAWIQTPRGTCILVTSATGDLKLSPNSRWISEKVAKTPIPFSLFTPPADKPFWAYYPGRYSAAPYEVVGWKFFDADPSPDDVGSWVRLGWTHWLPADSASSGEKPTVDPTQSEQPKADAPDRKTDDAGEGYRFLEPGETVQQGDEIRNDGQGFTGPWNPCEATIGSTISIGDEIQFRRKVEQQPIPVSIRRPVAPCWIFDQDRIACGGLGAGMRGWFWASAWERDEYETDYTHWLPGSSDKRPTVEPPIPAPVQTEPVARATADAILPSTFPSISSEGTGQSQRDGELEQIRELLGKCPKAFLPKDPVEAVRSLTTYWENQRDSIEHLQKQVEELERKLESRNATIVRLSGKLEGLRRRLAFRGSRFAELQRWVEKYLTCAEVGMRDLKIALDNSKRETTCGSCCATPNSDPSKWNDFEVAFVAALPRRDVR